MQKTFAFKPILSDLDEDDISRRLRDQGCSETKAFIITIYDDNGANPEAETAFALFCPELDRLGIAWGADATWADVESVETGIEMWLNDPTEWEARN